MSKRKFTLRSFVEAYLAEHVLSTDHILFRLYQPDDNAFGHFSRDDWNMIFPNVTLTQFNQWQNEDNIVMLTAIDRESLSPFGLLCFMASKTSSKRAYFHGGTWHHTTKDMLLAYEGLIYILDFMLQHNIGILVTCLIENAKANRFQNSLGFIEFGKNEELYYKYLDYEQFQKSSIVSRFL